MARWKFRKASRRTGRWLMVLLALVPVAGCERRDGADALLVDYQRRVSNVLDVDAPTPRTPPNIAAFPSRDARLFDIPETRQGMLDVYALRECGIVSLVARRNSQLGRVAAPSQRWLYELELWRKLRQCWNGDAVARLDSEDRNRLRRLTHRKTTQLPRASWNALFGSSEWVDSFSRASTALSPDDALSLSDDLAALAYLRQGALNQFNPTWSPSSRRLEAHLQTLQSQPLTARLLRGLLLARQRLDEMSQILDIRLAQRPVCYKGHSNPTADRLHGVFIASFIGEVQPYLATLTRQSRQWLEAVNALLDAHPVSRPAIDRYRHAWLSLENPDAPWQRFHAATQRHVELWQQIWRSCDLMPSAEVESGA